MQRIEPAGARPDLLRALMLTTLISADITRLISHTLGRRSTGNREVQVLLLLQAHPGLTPSAVAERAGMQRNALSRVLRHLTEDRLVRPAAHQEDGRSKLLYPTREAQSRVDALDAAVGDYLVGRYATLREIVTLLSPDGRRGRHLPHPDALLSPIRLVENLSEAAARYVDDVMSVADEHGLTSRTERAALFLICHDGEIRPSTLGAALHLTSGGTTVLLGRLERSGLVRRHRPDDSNDRRTVLVTCTPRGDEAAMAIVQVFERHKGPLVDALERLEQHALAVSRTG